MKWILSILLLISIGAIGQEDSTKYIWYKFQYGQRMPRGWWDSTAQLPYRDTTYTPARPGAIVMRPQDKQFYKWNGTLWSVLAGGGGGGGISLIKSAGSAYRLVLPPDSVRSVNIAGTWLFADTATDRKELRLGVDPQVGYGINIAPVTDVLSIDTTGPFSLVPQERLRDTAAAIRSAIGNPVFTSVTEKKNYYRSEQYVNHVVDDDGTIDADTAYNITDYIPITGNESVTISSSTGENITIYGWTYDANLTPISEIRSAALIGTQLTTYTFTTPSNAAYINIYTKISGQDFHHLLRINSTNTITYNSPVTPEQFTGANQSIKIQKALDFARFTSSHVELKGKYTIDSTIILSSGNTIVLNNAHLQLGPTLQNNMFRNESAKRAWPNNFKRGNRYIKIIGIGNALIEGSYENWGGSEPGWRSWTIQMNNVENFEIANLQFKATHGNVVDLVQSRIGHVHNLQFIESGEQYNQGGVEVIRGSNRITVENISGRFQDDAVTIGNLAYTDSFHIDGPDILDPYAKNLDVHNVIVRNVHQEPAGVFFYNPEPYFKGGVRLLSAESMVVRDCIIDGVTGIQNIYLQDPNPHYGTSTIDLMRNITIMNTSSPIWINAKVRDCSFLNIAKYDSSGTFQSAVPPDSSINITRKYYTESTEYNSFVGVNDWIKMADQFGTSGSDIVRVGNVNDEVSVIVRNLGAGSTAQARFRAENNVGKSVLTGIYSTTTTPFGPISANGSYTYSDAPGGYSIVQNESGTGIKFAAGGSTEQMRVMSTGIGIGETTPADALHITNFNGSLGQGSTLRLQQSSSDANRGNIDFYKSRGTPGSPSVVNDGDIVGLIRGYEHDGSSYLVNASMMFVADGAPSTGLTPGRISLFTRDASGNFNEGFRLNAAGNVMIGSFTTNGAKLQVTGRSSFSDTAALAARFSYNTNLGSSFTRYSLVDKNYVDSAITAGGGGGSVTGTGASGRMALWNGASALTSNSAILWGTSNGARLSIGTSNTQGVLNLGGNKDLSSSGAQSYFATATYTNTTTAASGTSSNYLINYIAAPTIAATNTGVTFPKIVTLAVDAPTAGTNATITNAYAIEAGGNVKVAGNMEVEGSETKKVERAADANTSINTSTNIMILPAITANRTLSLPVTPKEGIIYTIINTNSSGNSWQFGGGGSLVDQTGAAVTSFTNGNTYIIMGDNSAGVYRILVKQ